MNRRRALSLVAVGMAAAIPTAIVLSLRAGDLFGATFTATFTIYGIVGLVVARVRAGNRIALLFLVLGLVVPLAQVAAIAAIEGWPGGPWLGVLSSTSNPVVFGSLFIFLPLLFPTGSYLSARWGRFGRVALGVLVLISLVFILSPGPLDCCPGVRNPITVPGLGFLEASAPFVFPAVAATSLISFASLIQRYRRSEGVERLQLKWFVFAMVLIILAAVGGALASVGLIRENDVAPLIVFPTAAAGIAVAVGIAILRHRLYDIDVVINKTLVYGSLAAFITAVYVGVVVGIGSAFGRGDEPNLGLSILATAVVAVAFQPVRERIQRLANRVVYGKRATPYEVLSEFSHRMAGTYASEEILPRMARILGEGTGARADVYLAVSGELRREAAWPSENGTAVTLPLAREALPSIPGANLVVPVAHQGELLGALAIAKPRGDRLTPAEHKLATDLASQAGLVLRNVRLIAELRTSRSRIVAAQDEERRRIERNIHDGAQQELVAVGVKLGLARTLLPKNPAKTSELLTQLQEESRDALENLRDLARGIYPPLLADAGLYAALEAQARKAPLPVTVEADGVVRYPQEVESAVYFSVLEALQNVTKYADASQALIRLSAKLGELRFEVEDDGRGFDLASTPRGSGLTNLTDRLEALGGSIEVRSVPGVGTTVAGRVPTQPMGGGTG